LAQVGIVLNVVDVVTVVVVVVGVGQTSVTKPPPSVVTAGFTQSFSMRLCDDPPSGHPPAFVSAAENFPCAFGMHFAVSTGIPFAAAFE
jgi:hypothetical protein